MEGLLMTPQVMGISLLKLLLESFTSLFQLSSFESIKYEPVQKNLRKVEGILKLLKPILDAIVDAEITYDEMLQEEFAGLLQSVDELREILENWEPLMSKIYIVSQVQSLTTKIQTHGLESLELLKSSDYCRLPDELDAASLELRLQRINHMESEQASSMTAKAIKDQVEGSGASSDDLAMVADKLSLKSNEELLIEAVALEKLKENAEQAESTDEVEYIDQMIALVTHMHDLLVMTKQSQSCNQVPIPADFRCPLSLELMTDPVIVVSGQTYERAFIRKWIDHGLTVCPKTRQTLVHTNLIPNYTVKALIANWCESKAERLEVGTQVKKLVESLKGSYLNEQRTAISEIRLLANHNADNRIIIANCGAIPLLVNLLSSTDLTVQESAVAALLNLSIDDNNKSAIANADAIKPLIHILKTGSPEAKGNSAATLFSLAGIGQNKIKIGKSGAIKPLVDLLGDGTPRGKKDAAAALKDAAAALFNLSINHENKARIVQTGAVKYLVDLMDPAFGMADKAVAVLSNLATIPEGRTAIAQEGGIPFLVQAVELGSDKGKENAAAALLQLCLNSNRFSNIVLQQGAVPPLVALSQSGTPRAREKAQALLVFFRNLRHGNSGRD